MYHRTSVPTSSSLSWSQLESAAPPETACESQTAASKGKERGLGRERRGQGCQERGSRASSARAEAVCFCLGKGHGRGASGWVCRAGFGGRSGDAHPHREDLGPAGKDYRTLAHHLAYLEDEKYVGCIRIYVGLVVKSTSVAAARPESRRPAGRQTCNRGAKHSARVARACSSGQTDRLP